MRIYIYTRLTLSMSGKEKKVLFLSDSKLCVNLVMISWWYFKQFEKIKHSSMHFISFFILLQSISCSLFWNYIDFFLFWMICLCILVIDSLTTADIYSPCKRPPTLGVESGKIPNGAFFASSFVQGREPYTARLNGRYGLLWFSTRKQNLLLCCFIAWRPAYMDADQYLYVDLGSRYYVTGVATQGRRAAKEYVTVFNLMYSDNGHNWFHYTNGDKIIVVCSAISKARK